MAIVVLVLIMADRMWVKLPPDHPAVYRSSESAAQPGCPAQRAPGR
jgi:hypothetical protein